MSIYSVAFYIVRNVVILFMESRPPIHGTRGVIIAVWDKTDIVGPMGESAHLIR